MTISRDIGYCRDMTSGSDLRAKREAAGVSLNALAAAMRVHRSTAWRIELTHDVSLERVAAYMNAIDIAKSRQAA